MKFYKLIFLLIPCLIWQKATFSIVIDSFVDVKLNEHNLINGTDLKDLGISREMVGSWRPSVTGRRFFCGEADNESSITYKLNDSVINIDEMSTLRLKIYNKKYANINSDLNIILFDTLNNQCVVKVNLSDINPENMLKALPSDISLANVKNIDPGFFDSTNINKMKFVFTPNSSDEISFMLDSIEAVPEPFSMITLAGGTLGFIRKRYKR